LQRTKKKSKMMVKATHRLCKIISGEHYYSDEEGGTHDSSDSDSD
jgi:hypothetical protein